MKKFLIGTALCALVAAPALAADPAETSEPITLSVGQMDGLTAGGCVFAWCSNFNSTYQNANAVAVAVGGSSFFSAFSSNASANAYASNDNDTEQENGD